MLMIPDSGSFQAQPQTPEDIAIETIFKNTWQYSRYKREGGRNAENITSQTPSQG